MRSKEASDDYMYFPEPDILPIVIDDAWVERVKNSLPEMPQVKRRRYLEEYGLNHKEVDIILAAKKLADVFDEAIACGLKPQIACNWIKGDIGRGFKRTRHRSRKYASRWATLIWLGESFRKGTISHTIAAKVLELMFDEPGTAREEIVAKHNMAQIPAILEQSPKFVKKPLRVIRKQMEDYKTGKGKAVGALVGYVMKATKGRLTRPW